MLEMLRRETQVETYASGQVVFTVGEVGDSMFAVVDGQVEIRQGERASRPSGPAACSARWR